MEEEKARRLARMEEERAQLANDKARMENEKARIELEKARLKLENLKSGGSKAAGNVEGGVLDDDEGERFPGLPQGQIVKLFGDKFKPINLYRLYRGRGFRQEEEEDGTHVVNGVLKMKKVGVTYKDYGTSFYDVWSEAFFLYSDILFALFGKTSPDVFSALGKFRTKIHELSQVYERQAAVLPLAMDAHTDILATQPTEAASCAIRQKLQEFHCTPLKVLGNRRSDRSAPRRRSRSPIRRGSTNNSTVICESFNKGLCNWQFCGAPLGDQGSQDSRPPTGNDPFRAIFT